MVFEFLHELTHRRELPTEIGQGHPAGIEPLSMVFDLLKQFPVPDHWVVVQRQSLMNQCPRDSGEVEILEQMIPAPTRIAMFPRKRTNSRIAVKEKMFSHVSCLMETVIPLMLPVFPGSRFSRLSTYPFLWLKWNCQKTRRALAKSWRKGQLSDHSEALTFIPSRRFQHSHRPGLQASAPSGGGNGSSAIWRTRAWIG
jgi:hypothetical protein